MQTRKNKGKQLRLLQQIATGPGNPRAVAAFCPADFYFSLLTEEA